MTSWNWIYEVVPVADTHHAQPYSPGEGCILEPVHTTSLDKSMNKRACARQVICKWKVDKYVQRCIYWIMGRWLLKLSTKNLFDLWYCLTSSKILNLSCRSWYRLYKNDVTVLPTEQGVQWENLYSLSIYFTYTKVSTRCCSEYFQCIFM